MTIWSRISSLRQHRPNCPNVYHHAMNPSTFFSSNIIRWTTTNKSSKSRIRIAKDSRTHFVFGANTDVGKTVLCAGLVKASLETYAFCNYIKPLQCGASDEEFLQRHVNNPSQLHSKILFHWQTPTSPHAASRQEHQPASDEEVLETLVSALTDISVQQDVLDPFSSSTTWIETAGGVLSPSSASPLNRSPRHAFDKSDETTKNNSWGWTTQGDLYQPLNGITQVVLVGDGRLGGISCTLSALESLILRGYTVAAVVILSSPPFDNVSAIREYANRQFKLRSGTGQVLFQDPHRSIVSLPPLPPLQEPLDDWYRLPEVVETMQGLNNHLQESWEDHVELLQDMRQQGRDSLWWPFTQHSNVTTDDKVTLIDSAHGDHFSVLADSNTGGLEQRNLVDGSASWWTQGVGHGDSSLALAAAAAAGRYGHVLFPDIVHEPAIRLSQKLLSADGPGYGWADRVFFTDDGSTAMEVAIKMGMRTYQERHGMTPESDPGVEWIVCAQQDCYHGDTLGVMDVEEPSIFNQNQHPWYQSKGLLLATPTLGFCEGALEISYPLEWGWPKKSTSCSTLEEVMNIEKRLTTAEYSNYVDSIKKEWDDHLRGRQMVVTTVVLEPILMGAGGMKFVDPLWQRAVMDIAKSKDIPIIFDEVAAGLYRVGVKSCRELLKCDPDIASYAKLLSGGLVPLSATLATSEVFDAFLGDKKSQALLHGHSYTAHPLGCVSSIHALECYEAAVSATVNKTQVPLMKFDLDQVKALSHLPLVEHSFSLGTVLAITIRLEEGKGSGYAATNRSLPLIQKLRDEGVFVRPLGNVIYVMVSPVTSREDCTKLCDILHRTIEKYGRELQLA